MSRLAVLALACAAFALPLAACGDDEESQSDQRAGGSGATVTANPTPEVQTSTQGEQQEPNDVVSVGMKDIKFVPEKVSAQVGQKVVWTNNEAIPHNVTATDGADFASDTLQKDQTFEYTPTEAGTIKYVCTIHSGQNGEITVTK